MKSLASVLLLLTACASEPDAPEGDPVTSYVDTRVIPIGMNAKVDVLFVIDNTSAMLPAKDKIARDLRDMVTTIVASREVSPDLHVGVITSDPSFGGQLRGPFFADAMRFAWEPERNYQGDLSAEVAASATISGAASYSWPLETILKAVGTTTNDPFLRDDAYLAIVILTAGDDHSMLAPADAARMLKSVKSDPSQILVAGAFGACSEGGITATAAPQLDAFLAEFPNRSTKTTLCAPDLTPLTALVGQLSKATLGIACMEHVAEPRDCAARLVDPETGDELPYRACDGAADTRCYHLEAHAGCPTAGSLAVVPRPWRTPFPATAILECVSR